MVVGFGQSMSRNTTPIFSRSLLKDCLANQNVVLDFIPQLKCHEVQWPKTWASKFMAGLIVRLLTDLRFGHFLKGPLGPIYPERQCQRRDNTDAPDQFEVAKPFLSWLGRCIKKTIRNYWQRHRRHITDIQCKWACRGSQPDLNKAGDSEYYMLHKGLSILKRKRKRRLFWLVHR